MATDVARLAMEFTTNGARRVQSEMEALRSGSVRLTRATQQQIAESQRLSSTFRAQAASTRIVSAQSRQMSNSFRGVALQLNQVVQQGAVTGNFFQALAVQIPDLVVGMGPLGIILGGLAGGFATLALSSGEADESLEDLTDRTKELVNELGRATDLQRQFINAQFQQSIQDQKTAITEAEESIRSVNARLEDFRRAVGEDVPDAVFNSNSAVKSLRQELSDAELSIDNAESSIESITKQQKEFWEEVEETGNKLDDTTEKLNTFVESIVAQGETVGLTARETALYEAARLGANEADIQAINNAFDLIEAEKQKQIELKRSEERQKATRRALLASTEIGTQDDPLLQRIAAEKRGQQILLEQQQQYKEARDNLDQQIISSASSTVGALANVVGDLAGRQSNAYRAAFLAQQGFAIASSIVNTQMAAAAALAPPPIGLGPVAGLPYAQTIEALGAANVAIIAGQTVAGLASSYSGGDESSDAPSFAGGGFTGTGPRSGGLDGRGGFPAILHPNETVIDHTRGQGMGGGVVVNIVNAPQGTRTETRQDADGRQIIDVFVADMATGGPMSKSMQGTFGLKRQGR